MTMDRAKKHTSSVLLHILSHNTARGTCTYEYASINRATKRTRYPHAAPRPHNALWVQTQCDLCSWFGAVGNGGSQTHIAHAVVLTAHTIPSECVVRCVRRHVKVVASSSCLYGKHASECTHYKYCEQFRKHPLSTAHRIVRVFHFVCYVHMTTIHMRTHLRHPRRR